jgi:hypothetical protein
MGIELVDKSGEMRSEQEFMDVHRVVTKRLVTMSLMKTDPELMMQLTTILEALKIAAAVARTKMK